MFFVETNNFARAMAEGNAGVEIQDQTTYLRVVKDDAVSFVTQKARTPIWMLTSNDVRGDMYDLSLFICSARHRLHHLIPRERFVRCDVEGFPSRGGMSKKTKKSNGKVSMMRERP